jgi:4-amino-4-deoxy-L-arabinose transferase-like glycosyltransferase
VVWWPASRRSSVILASILLLCLGARLGWMLHVRSVEPALSSSPDTSSYVNPARALADDHHFTVGPNETRAMFLRTPGYPAFLAGAFVVTDDNETAALTVQVLVSVVTAWMAFLIAGRLWGETAGIVAAAINAFDPLQFEASGKLLTETLSALALLAIVGVGYKALARRPVSAGWTALLGTALAVATLIRPTTYYFPVLVVPLLVVARWRAGPRAGLVAVAEFLVPIIVLVGGWQLRNQHEVGSLRFSGIEAVNMYQYRAAGVLAEERGTSAKTQRLRLAREFGPLGSQEQGPYYDRMFDKGFTIVRSHPVQFAKITIKGLGREVGGVGQESISNYLRLDEPTLLTALLALGLLAFWLATAAGIVFAFVRDRARWLGHVLALATASYVLVASAGPEAYSRFRVPVTPILSLFAAFGVVTLVRWVTRGLRSRSAGAPAPARS